MESKESVLRFEVPVENPSPASSWLVNTALLHKETRVDQRFEDMPDQRFWNVLVDIPMVLQYLTQITIGTILHVHLDCG
jgi:cytochrome c biogenesis factor